MSRLAKLLFQAALLLVMVLVPVGLGGGTAFADELCSTQSAASRESIKPCIDFLNGQYSAKVDVEPKANVLPYDAQRVLIDSPDTLVVEQCPPPPNPDLTQCTTVAATHDATLGGRPASSGFGYRACASTQFADWHPGHVCSALLPSPDLPAQAQGAGPTAAPGPTGTSQDCTKSVFQPVTVQQSASGDQGAIAIEGLGFNPGLVPGNNPTPDPQCKTMFLQAKLHFISTSSQPTGIALGVSEDKFTALAEIWQGKTDLGPPNVLSVPYQLSNNSSAIGVPPKTQRMSFQGWLAGPGSSTTISVTSQPVPSSQSELYRPLIACVREIAVDSNGNGDPSNAENQPLTGTCKQLSFTGGTGKVTMTDAPAPPAFPR